MATVKTAEDNAKAHRRRRRTAAEALAMMVIVGFSAWSCTLPPTVTATVVSDGTRRIIVLSLPAVTEAGQYQRAAGTVEKARQTGMPVWSVLDRDPYAPRADAAMAGPGTDRTAVETAAAAGWQPRVQVADAIQLTAATTPAEYSWIADVATTLTANGRLGAVGRYIARACISAGPCGLPRDDGDAQAAAVVAQVTATTGDALLLASADVAADMVPLLRRHGGLWAQSPP